MAPIGPRPVPGGDLQRKSHDIVRDLGIWSSLKRGPLANLACPAFGQLIQVLQHGIRKIQRRPRLIEGCLTETGLTMETA